MRSIDVVVEAVVTFAGAAGFAHTLAPLRRGQQDPCFRVPGDGTIWRTSLLPTGPVTARISRAGRDAARCVAWGSGAEEFVDMAPAMLGAADDASDFVPLHPAVAAAHRRLPNLRLGRTGQVLEALIPAVIAARAVETAATNPLIRDEFAKVLVSSAGTAWARLADADLAWLDGDQLGRRVHRVACDYQAVRTHFFDEYFGAAVDAGVRQVVILAAGLDARAYRLNWPAGTVVYEIDQPSVLEYKAGILQSHGAVPTARRHAVAVDLRDDWPAALIAAGFDGTQPTAWLAEGLLPYLPGDAADRLFDMVTALSAPGSQVAVEAFTMNTKGNTQRWNRMRERLGLDIDVQALTYHEPDRSDAAQWLATHGWQVHSVSNREEMARLGRAIPQDLVDETVRTTLLRGRLVTPAQPA